MTSVQHNPHDLLPRLKGAPLSVLLALWRDGAAGRKTLIARTGWRKDTVSRALKVLVEMGLAERLHHREWSLAADVDVPLVLGICGEDREREKRPAVDEGRNHRSLTTGEERKERSLDAGNERNNRSPQYEEREKRSSARRKEREKRSLAADQRRENRPPENEGRKKRHSVAAEERPNRSLGPRKGRNRRSFGQERLKKRSAVAGKRKKRSPEDDSLHDHDMYVVVDRQKEHLNQKEKNNIIHALHALSPPFDNAERWLNSTSPELVQAWLDYLERMDPVERLLIYNEAGFIRSRVTAGQRPPASQSQHNGSRPVPAAVEAALGSDGSPVRQQVNARHWQLAMKKKRANPPRPCPDCGRSYRDYSGRCLVCTGIAQL